MNKELSQMVKVDFALMPREPRAECVWIYVNGQLVEKCGLSEKDARLAAYGFSPKRRGGWQSGAKRAA